MSKSPSPARLSSGGDEAALHSRIHALVVTARQTVARGVDLIQVRTNFEIGRHVVEHEQQGRARAGYGKDVLKNLAQMLTAEFGGGFSLTNLKPMRQFYLQNAARIGQTLSDLSLPVGANIHARAYQLYLPSKEELQRKLQEWVGSEGG
jgi:DUF1016 N-terminal domain